MIRMDNIPEHIRESLKSYYKNNEKPDVFPSKFLVDGTRYYYFAFSPAKEQLIMKEDGTIPSFHEVKRAALICQNYNASIETIIHIGNKWVKSGTNDKYSKLIEALRELKDKLSLELMDAHQTYVMTAETILENQSIIEKAVKEAKAIWDRTNHAELATEQDQIEMRKHTLWT